MGIVLQPTRCCIFATAAGLELTLTSWGCILSHWGVEYYLAKLDSGSHWSHKRCIVAYMGYVLTRRALTVADIGPKWVCIVTQRFAFLL